MTTTRKLGVIAVSVMALTLAACTSSTSLPSSTRRSTTLITVRSPSTSTTGPKAALPVSASTTRDLTSRGGDLLVSQFTAIGADVAWASTEPVASSSPTKPFPQRIIRTTDGGLRWQNLTPPGLALAEGDRYILHPPDFLDADHAWVVHGGVADGSPQILVATSDGGSHWSTLGRLPSPYCEVQFVDAAHGWCVASGAASGQEQVSVYQTTDGGRRWSLVSKSASITGTPGSPGSLPVVCDKQLTFLTPRKGWASFSCPVGLSPIYETTDGGRTWVGRAVKAPPPRYEPSNGYPADWVALPTVTGADGAAGLGNEDPKPVSLVYRTTDGGASWQPVPSPGKPRNWSIDLVNATDWKLASGRTILATNNAGHSWQEINSYIALGYGSDYFVTPEIGWYPGGNTKEEFRTTDGGRIWRPVHIPDLGI
jgi:photosystem II stability/assembly factor-like uncharacterized protein